MMAICCPLAGLRQRKRSINVAEADASIEACLYVCMVQAFYVVSLITGKVHSVLYIALLRHHIDPISFLIE